jgi:hypothetical protein
MRKNWYNILPWIALISGCMLAFMLILSIFIYPIHKNTDNKENRELAYGKLKTIGVVSKETITQKSFPDSVNKILNSSPVNTVWIISREGKIIYANGQMSPSTPLNESVYNMIENQSLGLIDAVKDNFDPIQKQILFTAAAIRHEGEHNDIYGHLVMPLKTPQNEVAGFIAVAYSLNSSKTPVETYIIILATLFCFLVYWISIPLWVYFDSQQRTDKSIYWTLFVLIGNLPAYIAYLITKK